MNTNLEIACEKMAKRMLFGNMAYTYQDLFQEFDIQLRKNKTTTDVANAYKKGIKAGMQKTEIEIEMVTFYLSKVLKLA